MKRRFTVCFFTMLVVVLFSLSSSAEAAGLQVEGKRFVKDGKPVYLLVGDPDVCNAQFIGKSINQWTGFGQPLSQRFKDMFLKQLGAIKGKKIAVIQFFSALFFRSSSADGRGTGIDKTVWWNGGVEQSWQRFLSPEAVKMQRELMDFAITEAQKASVDFTFSLMWEAQVVQKRPGFLPWFNAHRDYLKKKYNIPVGLHSHRPAHVAAADFSVIEGDYAKHLHMLHSEKPVVILARNPGKFTPGNKCKSYNDNWKAVANQLKAEMLDEFKNLGSTGFPYRRWVDKNTMMKEMKACKGKIKNYDFTAFANDIKAFCTELLEKAKTGNL